MYEFRLELSAIVAALSMIQTNSPLASTVLSVDAVADTFISSDPNYADRDLSAFGAMQISANLPNPVQGINDARTLHLLVAYDTATIKAGFDAQYGDGNWHVTDVQVKWYSNFDILGISPHNPQFNVPAAGAFNIALLANNQWFDAATAGAQGLANPDLNWNAVYGAGGAYNTLLDGMQTLGTYAYDGGNFNGTNNCANDVCAPRFWDLGDNPDLFDIVTRGGFVSLFGSAADSQVTYLVNQITKPGAHPQIFVSAAAGASPVPIPAAAWLFLSAGLSLLGVSTGKTRARRNSRL
ncbi:hypothetical protein sS8_3089 [Methylocaldum marinum]|uniref:Uncharacterized protein n=1 Tax=Methylocaldum marinum TaxID=1432792 RepID=A0A250KTY4_9GAMM|nr:hypothetical protein [Methylocaldum marinum]BBA35032.1 hypothetical protein sS8_3089 [Methylocaldum marinum]